LAGRRAEAAGCLARAGLANLKTVGIEAAAGEKLRLTVTKTQAKAASTPSKKTKSSTMAASSGRKVCKAVAADVAKYRPDLKARAARRGWALWAQEGKKCARDERARRSPSVCTRTRLTCALPTHLAPRRTPPCAALPPCRSRCA
jgi:hypothetical protein